LTKVNAITHIYKSDHWIPKDDDPSFWEEFRAPMTHRQLQDELAYQCPALEDLSIRLDVRGEMLDEHDREGWSRILFSLESIVRLEISFAHFIVYGDDVPETFFSFLIRNLLGLKELILVDKQPPFRSINGMAQYEEKIFVIQSISLVTLNVEDYRRQISFCCECPRLENFICKGTAHGNWQVKAFQKLLDESGTAPLVRSVLMKNVSPRSTVREEVIEMTREESHDAYFYDDTRDSRWV
jgi:hypothetical protein